MENIFAELTRTLLKKTKDFSETAGSVNIETEYLVLALPSVMGQEFVNNVFASSITEESVAEYIQEFYQPTGGEITGRFSDEFRTILTAAAKKVNSEGTKSLKVEHVLLAVLENTETHAHKMLNDFKVDIQEAVDKLLVLLVKEDKSDGSSAPSTNAGAKTAVASGKINGTKAPAILSEHATNLSALAEEGKLDPVIGRDVEIERTVQILARRSKNNPVLVGEPGVGKTAIVEGLAQRLIDDSSLPDNIRSKQIYSLDLGSLISGTRYRGDFEKRLKTIIAEVQADKNIILFVDEIHAMVAAGGGEGSLNAANILKPVLARGELQTIGATTHDEYRKYFEKDPALARRFQEVVVNEPDIDDTIAILRGVRGRYEHHHKVNITDAALVAAAKLAARYISDRFMPDKAFDVIDETGAKTRMAAMQFPTELKEAEDAIIEVRERKQAAIHEQNFDKAAELREEEDNLTKRKAALLVEWKAAQEQETPVVTADDVARTVSLMTGIPVHNPDDDFNKRLVSMEEEIGKRVIGQEEAIHALSRTVRRQYAGLSDPNRPNGSFIFAGPTGVGKTELAKALAAHMFGTEDALITFDMSEYGEKHTVSRLFGAPPGYVGHEEGGQLTERIRRNPYAVILFDEIEKAHPDIFNSLLQVLEEGRLTDGQGRVVNFKNTIIILTTNLGSKGIVTGPVGFQLVDDGHSAYVQMKSKVSEELKREFKPEFLNRLDDTIVFPQLTATQLKKIVDIYITDVNSRLVNLGFTIELSDAAKEFLISVGYDATLGARPLRRAVQTHVEDGLSDIILQGNYEAGSVMHIDADETGLVFEGALAIA